MRAPEQRPSAVTDAVTAGAAATPRRGRRWVCALVAALALAVVGMVGAGASPAWAHSQLVSSSPAAGERLDPPPSTVELRFSQSLLTVGAAIVVADTGGKTWTRGDPVVAGAVLTAPLREGLPVGAYEVRWRIVSADGHSLSGAFPFTVGTPAASALATASSTAPSTTPAGVGPAPTAARSAQPSGTGQATASNGGGPVRLLVVGGLGALGALGLYALYAAVRQRSRRGPYPGAKSHAHQ